MQHLILRTGPALVLRAFRPEPDDLARRPRERDVTDRAHEFLFEAITLHRDTTLADVFGLMETGPLLKRVVRPAFVEELCAEASKGPTLGKQQPAHERIEVLALYAEWGLDTHTQTYTGTTRLRLHGVGPVLQQDRPEEHKRTGTSRATASRELVDLEAMGLLKQVGAGRSTCYDVAPPEWGAAANTSQRSI